MFFVYIIYSESNDSYYIGMTENIESRLAAHNKKEVKSTKSFAPWKLVHREEYLTRLEARIREKYLKSAAGRRWRKYNLGH
jgi:putative endonuclease